MPVEINENHMIPVAPGQAVGRGWLAPTGRRPMGVTWHWTATRDLATCRQVLGGADALRKGIASAHYGVGRSFEEGIDRYVALGDRAWHAGRGQTLRWDGRRAARATRGARATIGVETVNIGFARPGVAAGGDWIAAATPNGRHVRRIQPWTDEQVEMMIQVGKEIVARWPRIGPRDHHGHHDVCPGYKEDVAGFPFAPVLRGIYEDEAIPDVWGPLWLPRGRQKALIALGYDLGDFGPDGDGADGVWGRFSDDALARFQEAHGQVVNGMWTTFTSWAVYDAIAARGLGFDQILA
ncbi:MAG: N-acetylmuramoyl-L-alanine amidase [Rhodospirillales bacterium]|nr:MAG: N-acetylmuramoyl-L-alanine amidase [Rhodospirillales bacterium]